MPMSGLTVSYSLWFLKEEVVQSVVPEETSDGYAFQISENQSTFNF